MTKHTYRQLLYTELLQVDPSKLIAALVDHEKAKSISVDNKQIDTHEALEQIAGDLGFKIVTDGDKLRLTETLYITIERDE